VIDQIKSGPESRSDWMLKRFEFAASSNQRNTNFQFWQVNSHPIEIFFESFLWSKLNYIHVNPVRAGIVARASNYVERESLIPITLATNPIINPLKRSGFDQDISLW
ncbi:MAG: hypothetical protein ACRCVT_11355, partial [Leadbetterella sp.]